MKLFQKVKENRKKKNNKGFSLVELIIVIAIMAILIAVLAPTFTKYVDRSRQSNDASMVTSVVNAMQAAAVDTMCKKTVDAYKIELKGSGAATISAAPGITDTYDTSTDQVKASIEESCGSLSKLNVTSNAWKKDGITIIYSVTSGAITYTPDTFATYINKK